MNAALLHVNTCVLTIIAHTHCPARESQTTSACVVLYTICHSAVMGIRVNGLRALRHYDERTYTSLYITYETRYTCSVTHTTMFAMVTQAGL